MDSGALAAPCGEHLKLNRSGRCALRSPPAPRTALAQPGPAPGSTLGGSRLESTSSAVALGPGPRPRQSAVGSRSRDRVWEGGSAYAPDAVANLTQSNNNKSAGRGTKGKERRGGYWRSQQVVAGAAACCAGCGRQ